MVFQPPRVQNKIDAQRVERIRARRGQAPKPAQRAPVPVPTLEQIDAACKNLAVIGEREQLNHEMLGRIEEIHEDRAVAWGYTVYEAVDCGRGKRVGQCNRRAPLVRFEIDRHKFESDEKYLAQVLRRLGLGSGQGLDAGTGKNRLVYVGDIRDLLWLQEKLVSQN